MMHGLHFVVLIFGALNSASAFDPFSGSFPRLDCFQGRTITGCNETLLEAYSRTEFAKTDETINTPDTWVHLFTRRNKKNPENLHSCGGKLPSNTNYRTQNKTVILIPGWMNSPCNNAFYREMRDQFLFREDLNVILIDWSWGSGGIDYYSSVINSRTTGKQIAFIIQNIIEQTGVSGDMFHVIGHSLGAQAAGFSGQYLQYLGIKLRRITGLDPALPGYRVDDPDQKLDQSDAEWVDVMHTNGGPCVPTAFGDFRQVGHADFYVNGGSVQLSCYTNILPFILKGDVGFAISSLIPTICFHTQCVQYFKASINPCKCQFVGVECDSYASFKAGRCRECGEDGSKCAVMGLDWENYPRKRGNHSYYLDTSLFCPYCDNKGIKLQGFPINGVNGSNVLHCFQ